MNEDRPNNCRRDAPADTTFCYSRMDFGSLSNWIARARCKNHITFPCQCNNVSYLHCRFYKMRSDRVEWFHNRNPLSPELGELLDLGLFLPLKDKDENGSQVFVIRTGVHNPKKHSQNDVMKVSFMVLDLALHLDESISIFGAAAIFDMSSVTMAHGLQMTPVIIKRYVPPSNSPGDLLKWFYRLISDRSRAGRITRVEARNSNSLIPHHTFRLHWVWHWAPSDCSWRQRWRSDCQWLVANPRLKWNCPSIFEAMLTVTKSWPFIGSVSFRNMLRGLPTKNSTNGWRHEDVTEEINFFFIILRILYFLINIACVFFVLIHIE